ncbi:MAG: hypothetical protein J3Q66DRAFT_361230 [Benniella sp.]|nr:MAG: hypothetical protein J3Q66DRAFT_361230 [Benniella sp.]
MVTTRSRVKREAVAASATAPTATETSDLPAPVPIKQRKRKNSAVSSASSSISSSSTLTPPSKLAKTDLTLEELPPAPAPTPVTQLTQPPLAETVVTQPVDVAAAVAVAAAELSAEDLADTNARSMMKSQPEAPAPMVAAAQEMEELPLEASSAVLATTLPNTQVPTMMMSTTTTVPDISALESVKEPVPEAKPLPEVATVLTQPPVAATVTTITPVIAAAPTAMDFDSTTTMENVPPAPTAPQLSAITAPAPVPASIAPVLSFGSTVPLSNAALTNTLMAAPAAPSATDKPLPPTPLETSYMATNMVALDPTSLLLAPNAGLPDVSSTMTATTTPASVAMLPGMTVTTVGTLPYQPQATATKNMNGSAADIAMVTNDIQPQLMPQQQVNRSGKLLPVMSGTDSPGIGNAKGPSQSGV